MLHVSTSQVSPVVTRVHATGSMIGEPVTHIPLEQVRGVHVLFAVPV
jgi:hypothetical protein